MRHVNVFLVGEGPNDIGDLASEREYRPRRPRDGFLQPVLRKLAGSCTLSFQGIKLAHLKKTGIKGAASVLETRAAQAAAVATYYRADVLVFATDLDRLSDRPKNLGREHAASVAWLRRAAERGPQIPAVIAVPARTIEAWALGDLAAVGRVSGGPVQCPKEPEELWGKPHDPTSNHPKSVFDRAFNNETGTADYAAVADELDVETVSLRCPISFAAFAAECDAVRADLESAS